MATAMDLLEGVASGQYFRRDTSVTTSLAAEPLTCVAYFYKPNEVLLGLPHISDYNAEAHAQYQVLLVRSVVGFSSNFALTPMAHCRWPVTARVTLAKMPDC